MGWMNTILRLRKRRRKPVLGKYKKKEKKEKKKAKKTEDGKSDDYSYKIKIKPKNELAEPDSTTGPDGKPQKSSGQNNKHLIRMIKDAVGESTQIEEDKDGQIIVFINSNQQMNKKQ